MIRAYLYALDPTPAQEQAFRSHCGAQRVAYNWCLARVRANWAQRGAEQTYGLTGDQLTPWINTSAYGLRLAWNAAKPDVAPWWSDNSKEASSKTCSGCGTAKAKLALSQRTYVCMECGLVLDRDHNAARNLVALAADTGELRRELPDGSDVRPVVLARPAVAPPREESIKTQCRLREEVTR